MFELESKKYNFKLNVKFGRNVVSLDLDSSDFAVLSDAQGSNDEKFKFKSESKAEISEIDMNGNFQIQFSHPVFPLKLKSMKSKNPLVVNIIWMNEEILGGEELLPEYTVDFVSFTEDRIDVKLNFKDPFLISKGTQLDRLSVWFRDPAFFKRKSDN